ncbi:MAG: hypothetical protein QNJ05_09455 [Woeseiaceae bacterium]|nr:hypothetical protein [Woeseiaceae bacterium]
MIQTRERQLLLALTAIGTVLKLSAESGGAAGNATEIKLAKRLLTAARTPNQQLDKALIEDLRQDLAAFDEDDATVAALRRWLSVAADTDGQSS